MNEENKSNYYAIIPATVRYNQNLKSSEKLLYGEITALANKYGYSYATNRYFAQLYNVNIETVSRWLSHLQELGFIKIEIIKNAKKEIIARHIYIEDIPYCQKNQYPYCLKDRYSIDEKVKKNNINIIIDDLFNLIINNSNEVSNEFYSILIRLEFLYPAEILSLMKQDKIQMLKDIIYTLYSLYNSEFKNMFSRIVREELINLYVISKEHYPDSLYHYYRKAIINKYAK